MSGPTRGWCPGCGAPVLVELIGDPPRRNLYCLICGYHDPDHRAPASAPEE